MAAGDSRADGYWPRWLMSVDGYYRRRSGWTGYVMLRRLICTFGFVRSWFWLRSDLPWLMRVDSLSGYSIILSPTPHARSWWKEKMRKGMYPICIRSGIRLHRGQNTQMARNTLSVKPICKASAGTKRITCNEFPRWLRYLMNSKSATEFCGWPKSPVYQNARTGANASFTENSILQRFTKIPKFRLESLNTKYQLL